MSLNGQPGVRSTNEAGGDVKEPADKGSGIAPSGGAPTGSAAGGNSEGTPGLNPLALNLPGKTYVPLAALDAPVDSAPTMHVNYAEKVPWLTMEDELPKHDAFDDEGVT